MEKISNLINKILNESLEKRADEITEKIKNAVNEPTLDYGDEITEWGEDDNLYNDDEITPKKRFEIAKQNALERKKNKEMKNKKQTDIEPGYSEFDYVAETECAEGNCDEMEEGNAFSGALANAKEKGEKTFKVGSKKYNVQERNKEVDNVDESVTYTISFDNDEIILSENDLIAMIEEIVNEETAKSKGMTEYTRISKKEKNMNKEANKASFKKMKEYVKTGSKGSFEENAKHFPKGNGELGEMKKKAYIPSDAVDEYVKDFAYPGQTNLTFDEIKPNDEWIEMNLKGDSKTGNSQKYANAVETEVGERFYKNYEENPYGAEQKNASYKRQTQPVDNAGETKGAKTYKQSKGQKALDKLSEDVKTEGKQFLNEEMERMKSLLSYKKNTQ